MPVVLEEQGSISTAVSTHALDPHSRLTETEDTVVDEEEQGDGAQGKGHTPDTLQTLHVVGLHNISNMLERQIKVQDMESKRLVPLVLSRHRMPLLYSPGYTINKQPLLKSKQRWRTRASELSPIHIS